MGQIMRKCALIHKIVKMLYIFNCNYKMRLNNHCPVKCFLFFVSLLRGEGDSGVTASLRVVVALSKTGGTVPERPEHSRNNLPCPRLPKNGETFPSLFCLMQFLLAIN